MESSRLRGIALKGIAFVLLVGATIVALALLPKGAPPEQAGVVVPLSPPVEAPVPVAKPEPKPAETPVPIPQAEPPKPAIPPKPDPVAPAPPPAPAPVQDIAANVQKSLSEAARLIREARPIMEEVADTITPLPKDQGTLKTLLKRAEAVEQQLLSAQLHYLFVKKEAPETAAIDKRFWELDRLIVIVKNCIAYLKTKIA